MKLYSIIPHVADIRLRVRGKSPEQLFIAALEGMNRIMNKEYEKSLNRHTIAKEITLSSYDLTALLIDFLSEILTLSHIHKAIFHTIGSLEIVNNTLNAHVLGAKTNHFDEDIKAVTYHEANIQQDAKGHYRTSIVFDI